MDLRSGTLIFRKDINSLEKVQRQAARFIKRDYKSRECCVTNMLNGLGRVFTSNFSLAKINCHRNFGKVFAFTHSNEKLKRKVVEESLFTYFVT